MLSRTVLYSYKHMHRVGSWMLLMLLLRSIRDGASWSTSREHGLGAWVRGAWAWGIEKKKGSLHTI